MKPPRFSLRLLLECLALLAVLLAIPLTIHRERKRAEQERWELIGVARLLHDSGIGLDDYRRDGMRQVGGDPPEYGPQMSGVGGVLDAQTAARLVDSDLRFIDVYQTRITPEARKIMTAAFALEESAFEREDGLPRSHLFFSRK